MSVIEETQMDRVVAQARMREAVRIEEEEAQANRLARQMGIRVIKKPKESVRVTRYADSLLHILIEENFERAKFIIERIARSKRNGS